MNLAPTQFFGNKLLRRFCAALSVFLLTAAPALAEPVGINQVVRTVTNSHGISDLRLNTLVSQDPVGPGAKGSQTGPRNETATGAQDGTKTDALLSGVTVTSPESLGVELIEEGEVEGTICDCGEILVAGGAFPKWPFLFLAAVPLVFINDCDSCNDTPSANPTPTPPSTPTPTPTPEPASLLLFGSGLLAAGAGLRRRYTKSKLVAQNTAQEEEE